MSDNYSTRAANALEAALPGPHKAKRAANIFDVSLRTAKHLLAGQRWTTRRLAQASEFLGAAFDAALSRPDSEFHYNLEKQDHERRIAKLENFYMRELYLAQIARLDDPQISSQSGGGGAVEIGECAAGVFEEPQPKQSKDDDKSPQ